MKIVTEDKLVENRTGDMLTEWEKEKPVEVCKGVGVGGERGGGLINRTGDMLTEWEKEKPVEVCRGIGVGGRGAYK